LQAAAPVEFAHLPERAADDYAMSPDGARFAFTQEQHAHLPVIELQVVLDWLTELRQRDDKNR
jgi:hypothetical protein